LPNRSPRLDDGPAACEPWAAISLALALLGALRAALRTRTDLALENLALRKQLALLSRRSKRPRFGRLDRAFWVWLSSRWSGWRQALYLVLPETVVRWLRQRFRAFWTWKSHRGRVGRPLVSSEIADLVRTMALANPLWGAPRIHGELLKLGLDVSQRSVARLMPRRPKPPSQMWRTFLRNHLADLVSVDFFVVPTATFRVLYVFVVLLHHRRQVVHFNVTDSPTAAWTAQQLVEAFSDDSPPRYLLRDRDSIYGGEFRRRAKGMLIAEVLTASRAPWQNSFVERVIGTIRRELLDHVIVLNEGHLRRRLHSYLRCYHGSRTHLGSRRMLQSRAPSSYPSRDASLSCHRSADSTTATSAAQRSRRRRTLDRRRGDQSALGARATVCCRLCDRYAVIFKSVARAT
jgi:putative transposase